jgi:hypothetical protein
MNQDYSATDLLAPKPRKARHKWTDEDQRKAEKLRAEGMTYAAIADEIGCSEAPVQRNLRNRARGATAKPRKALYRWTEEDQRKAELLRKAGLSYAAIAREIGCSGRCAHMNLCPENREVHKAAMREWRKQNTELDRARKKLWREQNPENQKSYYRQNIERIKARNTEYLKQNREQCNETRRRRKAAKRASRLVALSPLTLVEKNTIFTNFGDCCAYCGTSERLSIDHVLPLSKGGLDEACNIVPACRSCNCSKNASEIEHWYRSQPFFTEERWLRIQRQCPLSVVGQVSLALPL